MDNLHIEEERRYSDYLSFIRIEDNTLDVMQQYQLFHVGGKGKQVMPLVMGKTDYLCIYNIYLMNDLYLNT